MGGRRIHLARASRTSKRGTKGGRLDAQNQKQDARSKMLVEETVLDQCICGSSQAQIETNLGTLRAFHAGGARLSVLA